jgi:hypothetical protein
MGSTASGATLDVSLRMETAERVPLASTPVVSRPPGIRFPNAVAVAAVLGCGGVRPD